MNTSVMMCSLSHHWSRFGQSVSERNKKPWAEFLLRAESTSSRYGHLWDRRKILQVEELFFTLTCQPVFAEQPNIHPHENASVWVQEGRASRKKRGCLVVTHHINKVQRGLITRTSICQAGRPYVSFLHGGLFVSCDFLQLPVMNTGLCIPD